MKGNVVSMRFEDDLGRYLDQARQQPLLSPERELELAQRWRDSRDPEAARELVASHLRLVVKIARGFSGYGFPVGELVAEGNVGLVQALTKFDPDRGFRFATYAMWWIRAAIQEHILHNWSVVKLGTTAAQKKLFFNLRRLKSRLGETGSGDLPPESVASIARDLAVGEHEVVEMNRRLSGGDSSLNVRVSEDGDREWGDTLVDEGQDQEELVADDLRLVVKIARGYSGYGFPIGELVAEGNVGLVQALTKFDPDRGFRFATYAMWWIRAAMQEHILHNWSVVKLGTTAAQKKLFFNLRRLKSRLGETGSGDLPPESVASIARDLAVGEHEVVEMNRRLSGGDSSLNVRVSEDGDREWGDTLVDEGQDQEELVADASELAWRRDLLAGAMGVLTSRERHILTERKLKEDPATLEDLAQVYGVSRERIRQIEARAFERVQKAVLATAANGNQRPALAA